MIKEEGELNTRVTRAQGNSRAYDITGRSTTLLQSRGGLARRSAAARDDFGLPLSRHDGSAVPEAPVRSQHHLRCFRARFSLSLFSVSQRTEAVISFLFLSLYLHERETLSSESSLVLFFFSLSYSRHFHLSFSLFSSSALRGDRERERGTDKRINRVCCEKKEGRREKEREKKSDDPTFIVIRERKACKV